MGYDINLPEKAIEKYKEVLSLHPGTDSAYYAELGLADVYCQLAEHGDGDGNWAKLAIEQLDHFAENNPDAPEIQWVKADPDVEYVTGIFQCEAKVLANDLLNKVGTQEIRIGRNHYLKGREFEIIGNIRKMTREAS